MKYLFGAAIKESHTKAYTATLIAVPVDTKKKFHNCILTYPLAKKEYPVLIITRGSTANAVITAACHRATEQLLIQRQIDPNKHLSAELLLRLEYRQIKTVIPVQKRSKHWLINAAQDVLFSWLRGER